MTKYVALLRGINVGGRTVPMAELKACFEALGFGGVTTLLQTGNVIFSSPAGPAALKDQIEAGLNRTFSYPAKAQVYGLNKLAAVVAAYPFGTAGDDQHDYVVFMENGLEEALLAETYQLAEGEQVKAGAGVVYWRVNKGSTLGTAFAKLLTRAKYKDFNTNRNLKTLKRLLAAAD